ncbi:MAG: hypothetical protein JSU63_07465 [Phycisphaerales bacterium]|nr:MAG: hypothetical protein JSU63_07465 [Phycisphaerales bacterium]
MSNHPGLPDNERATHMIRNVVIIVLVLASVAAAAAWAWSRAWEDAIGGWSARLGGITLAHEGYGYDLVLRVGDHPGSRWRPFRFGQLGGFGYSFGRGYARIWVPFWFSVCVLAAYPCFVLLKTRLRRRLILERQLEGLCTQCGYDLTGLTEPRCPECSAAIKPMIATARTAKALRLRDTFLLFVCLGIGYGVLSWLILLTIGLIASPYFGPADLASEFFGQVVGVVGYGAVVGIFWCSFGVPLLRRKPVRRIVIPLALGAGAAACVTVPLTAFIPAVGWIVVLVPTLSLVIACAIIRRTAPDAPIPDLSGDRPSGSAERTASARSSPGLRT